MSRGEKVNRPARKNDYEIVFASNSASKGWSNLVATKPNQMVGVWNFLTETPLQVTLLSYPLKGSGGIVIKDGNHYVRWQIKLNPRDGARIWYFVEGTRVYLEQVHTSHPNETK